MDLFLIEFSESNIGKNKFANYQYYLSKTQIKKKQQLNIEYIGLMAAIDNYK